MGYVYSDIATNIDELYMRLATELINRGEKVGNTHELNNVRLTLTDITKNIVNVRGISPAYLFGEWLWYFNGDRSLEFISQFSSFWKNISDDGLSCNSAYGYLIQHGHGFNQIDKVVEILCKDPDSRRAKININVPNKYVIETKDEPCTMSLHFMIRDRKLDCTAVMRSNDIWFGFPYDVAFFTELQKMIAERLHVGYGTYTHFAVSLHVYDRDYDKLKDIAQGLYTYTSINFNRTKFFNLIENLYKVVCDVMKEGNDGKEALMSALNLLDIYHSGKEQDGRRNNER